ncbi:hypothetical protein A3F02_03605 [Candidatus Curtissbacteria bacterium RIFCSPHIGHO2_12_FULL_38_9b]|uniref:TrbC/VIRB2 family protein n=1 Tax=Candidatus Curtissbacteria bacterium RIFCSPHIGHO2_12_FULL_38_9b TaxID=1797720 RepID=A0A1F5GSQ4_9BACT|nr:MAG: hypothetical protein A3F02_03605 [Candidatus Curtissbacteria bacterium RIFCSPHIGHO2_12_FULL_38_9b]
MRLNIWFVKIITPAAVVLFLVGLATTPSYAAVDEPAKLSGIVKILENIIGLLAPAAGIAFLIMLIIGGWQFMSSGGDPKAVGGAKNTLTFAIIGIILVIASWLILQLVAEITGAPVTTVNLPDN